ncbi:hypothetical protein Pcinc_008329 [Petrolisthes cinctipes]|uniref:Uncharacterized protein n=1 Tax=Petrolisthes cinctipes TaxID=88211 RepID=A0AAE1G7Q1_PETCI|nr:hypothetical protein Pcinc_008329 [Petrolisthes cinctipes]
MIQAATSKREDNDHYKPLPRLTFAKQAFSPFNKPLHESDWQPLARSNRHSSAINNLCGINPKAETERKYAAGSNSDADLPKASPHQRRYTNKVTRLLTIDCFMVEVVWHE